MVCGGKGHVTLPKRLQKVLESVARGNRTAPTIAADIKHKGTPTAINNSLEALRKLGLVVREPLAGNAWSYHLP